MQQFPTAAATTQAAIGSLWTQYFELPWIVSGSSDEMLGGQIGGIAGNLVGGIHGTHRSTCSNLTARRHAGHAGYGPARASLLIQLMVMLTLLLAVDRVVDAAAYDSYDAYDLYDAYYDAYAHLGARLESETSEHYDRNRAICAPGANACCRRTGKCDQDQPGSNPARVAFLHRCTSIASSIFEITLGCPKRYTTALGGSHCRACKRHNNVGSVKRGGSSRSGDCGDAGASGPDCNGRALRCTYTRTSHIGPPAFS